MTKKKILFVAFSFRTVWYFLACLAFFICIIATSLYIFYQYEIRATYAVVKSEEKALLQRQQKLIQNRLEPVISDLFFLGEQLGLMKSITKDHQQAVSMMEQEYVLFSRFKKVYDQIRFIDAAGQENIRINLKGENPIIVPRELLQSKKHRYYFHETIKLNSREIFISPLDLNIENRKIEMPLKPMLRFGTPVFDSMGQKTGVVILNYLGNDLLSLVRKSDQISKGNLMLLNPDGFWLCSPVKEDEWGFMFPERKTKNIAGKFNMEWDRILRSQEAVVQFETGQGLFTAITIHPVQNLSGQVPYFWKLISHIQKPESIPQIVSIRNQFKMLGLVFGILSSAAALFIARSIVRRKADQDALFHAANYDSLTNLPNRSMFMEHLNRKLNAARRYDDRFALLFIDLDGFKSINDQHGHDAGDLVLEKTAGRMLDSVRKSDMICRWGGDEFVILLNSVADADHLAKVARTLIQVISNPIPDKGKTLEIGASIGISIYPETASKSDTLLSAADNAMYEAKINGKNTWRFSNETPLDV